jgi:hypothetical protein
MILCIYSYILFCNISCRLRKRLQILFEVLVISPTLGLCRHGCTPVKLHKYTQTHTDTDSKINDAKKERKEVKVLSTLRDISGLIAQYRPTEIHHYSSLTICSNISMKAAGFPCYVIDRI